MHNLMFVIFVILQDCPNLTLTLTVTLSLTLAVIYTRNNKVISKIMLNV